MTDDEKHAFFVSAVVEQNHTLRGNLNLCAALRDQLETERRQLTARVADLERQIRALNTQHDRAAAAQQQAHAIRAQRDHEVADLKRAYGLALGSLDRYRKHVAHLESGLSGEREELQAARRTIKELKARLATLDGAARAEASAKRSCDIWLLRKQGVTYRKIAEQMKISIERARQIAMKAERQIARATEVYDGKVLNPIVYGVWHEFTHEGRVGLP